MNTTPGLQNVKHVLAVHSAKGGVGKSTVTANLATALARDGYKVGLLDADVHGPSMAVMLGNSEWPDPVKPGENVVYPVEAHGVKFISTGNLVTAKTPIIWRGAMVHQMLSQFFSEVIWGELDFLLIDLPPGTGDAVLTVAQQIPLDGALIVTTPQDLSVTDTVRGIQTFSKLKVPMLGLIENMSGFVCDGCGDKVPLFGEEGGELLARELGLPVLGRVPVEAGVSASGDAGKPLVLASPDSEPAKVLNQIAAEISAEMSHREVTKGIFFQWQDMPFYERKPEPSAEVTGNALPILAMWQVSGDELGIKWEDGVIDVFSIYELRVNCPCAACVEEMTGKRTLDPASVPRSISLRQVGTVGRYAIAPEFSDGHDTGIFHFGRLRALADQRKAGV